MKSLASAFLLLALPSAAAGSEIPTGVRDEVEQLIRASGAEVTVAFRTLDGTQELLIHPESNSRVQPIT